MCARNCTADRESVDTIKQIINELMEKCLLSEKTVATHKKKIQEIYDELIHHNCVCHHVLIVAVFSVLKLRTFLHK